MHMTVCLSCCFDTADRMGCVMIAGILLITAIMWYDKWCETHPHKPSALTETDAVIIRLKTIRRHPFQKKAQQRVLIYAGYPEPDGRQRNARLATAPLRQTLEANAPEIKKGEKIRICYEKKHPGVFYFADPAYQRPEISGVPYSVFSMAECIGMTLFAAVCIGCVLLNMLNRS